MYKLKRVCSLILVLVLLAGLALPVRAAEGPLVMDGTFTYRSAFLKDGSEAKMLPASYHYDENWFLAESTQYNHSLATMSLSMAMAAAVEEPSSIGDLFKALKFNDTTISYPKPTEETIGYAIGSKVISGTDGPFTLVAVAIRGGDYGSEWADNMRVGTGDTHAGFRGAADQVLAGIATHVKDYSLTGKIKVWITGYSRGAAVTNLTAHDLNVAARAGQLPGVTEQDIYAYCFEVPAGVTEAAVAAAPLDGNIFNINNPMDMVPMIAPAYWGYTTYGVTYHYPAPATAYKDWNGLLAEARNVYEKLMQDAGLKGIAAEKTVQEQTTPMSAQILLQKQVVEIIAAQFQNAAYYAENYQSIVMAAVGKCFGEATDILAAVPLIQEIVPFMLYQHRNLTNTLVENVYSLVQMHYPELSYAWMQSLDASQMQKAAKTRFLTVSGSADIALYDSTNTLVAKFSGGKAQTIQNSLIDVLVDDNGQQILTIPMDESFRVELTPTAGVLSWQVEEYDFTTMQDTALTRYDDVAAGGVYKGTFPAGGGCTFEGLEPTRQATGADIQRYAVTIFQQGQGTITGSGCFTEGQFALVTATTGKNGKFYGWYDGDQLVSTEATYRFRVEKDQALTAWFEEYKAPSKPDEPEEPVEIGLSRVAGGHRYETAFLAADRMKEQLGVEKFKTVVVASGTNFADALSGSYLAAEKNAPILLAYSAEGEKVDWINEDVKAYIRDNLVEGGTVYILGGEAAVPASFENGLDSFNVKRLAGSNRFDTNLLILKEAGVLDKSILVCTGIDFADSLSASATGQPILMVYGDKLTADQAAFMKSVEGSPIYIIGGTGAVSEKMEKALSAYGKPERLAGKTRFQTSVMIAEEFFREPTAAVLAYAWEFPDGLCGGPLATAIDAPLLLVMEKYEGEAAAYLEAQGITDGIILGGEARIPETTVNKLFPKA